MAWNPSPEVAVARDVAERLGKLVNAQVTHVVVSYVTDDGRQGYASYGANRMQCEEAKTWATELWKQTELFWS